MGIGKAMMRTAFGAACGLWLAFAGSVSAQANPVVVELYTSQGCSSCPPADDFLAELAARPDVIPLALHVDYWDYIGWEDSFAQPRFTARQKAYARAVKSRTIYTPQMIVDGVARVEGNDPAAVDAAIREAMARPAQVVLTATRQGQMLQVRATGRPGALPAVPPMVLQLIRLLPEQTVEIARGENAGQTVTYRNIVTSWEPVAEWAGDAPLDLALPMAGEGPVVLILQQQGPAEIVAAAELD